MSSIFGGPAQEDPAINPDTRGRIRVVVVGNSGCGKSCLAHLIASGAPAPSGVSATVGGAVLLRLLTYPLDRAKAQQTGPLANQEFFVELWDVAAAERYEPMRPLYYAGINGVILVHDLASPRSLPSLQRWAAEVTQRGAFSAPYSEERAALNVGGLPVPCMVIGNKLDLLPKYRRRQMAAGGPLYSGGGGPGEWLEAASAKLHSQLGALAGALPWRRGGGPGGGGMRREGSSGMLLHGSLQASAREGELDSHAVLDFFYQLIERRYCPGSRGSWARLSADDRLPTVMFQPISEESTPYGTTPAGGMRNGGTGRIDDLL